MDHHGFLTQFLAALAFISALFVTGIGGRVLGRALGHGPNPDAFPPEFMMVYGLGMGLIAIAIFSILFRKHIQKNDASDDRLWRILSVVFLCGVGIAGFLIMFYGLILR